MSAVTEVRHASAADSAAHLAVHVANVLKEAIARRGRATLAVSGGSTPALLFDRLSELPLDWARVTIAQVDERWVDAASPDSNQGLIRQHLLKGVARSATFVPMYDGAPDPSFAQVRYEAFLHSLDGPFDVILLGMGEDGHTASLFPGAAQLEAGLNDTALCLALDPPAASHQRLTLSLAGLLHSMLIVLQIKGTKKEAVYRDALQAGPVEAMPIRSILRQDRVPVEVWISS